MELRLIGKFVRFTVVRRSRRLGVLIIIVPVVVIKPLILHDEDERETLELEIKRDPNPTSIFDRLLMISRNSPVFKRSLRGDTLS